VRGIPALTALLLGIGLLVTPARGHLPEPVRIARAAAAANKAARRTAPLELEVAVRMDGEEEVAATGKLLTDPLGRARLELVHRDGFRERHLAVPGRYRASRDGASIERPRILLPPLYLLQVGRGSDLASWLAERGAPLDAELGYEEEHDCYVLGGREGRAALWIDQDTLTLVRVDLPGGHRVRYGPLRVFDGIQLPEWIDITPTGAPPVRLEIQAAAPSKPGPGAFEPAWLSQP